MFQSMITVLNSDGGYTEIVRATIEGRHLKPVFSVLKIGPNSLEEASQIFRKNNTLAVDEIFLAGFNPENVVFQHLEMPKIKSVKMLTGVAKFKAASQFSLSPDEVTVACLNSLPAIKIGIVPAFIITRTKSVEEFVSSLSEGGFPEPNVVNVKPFPIFKVAQTNVLEGNSIVFVIDRNYSMLFTLRGEEIVGLNYINEGFSDIADKFGENDAFSPNTDMHREFLVGSKGYYDSLIEEAAEQLEGMISYQLRIYLTNTLSNSPNTSAADEASFNKFFVIGQSSLSTAIYNRTFQRILGEETEVSPLPLKIKENSSITYTTAGMLLRGGEQLGRSKLVLKEEKDLQA